MRARRPTLLARRCGGARRQSNLDRDPIPPTLTFVLAPTLIQPESYPLPPQPKQVRGGDGCVVLRGRRRVERTQAEEQGVGGTYVAKRARGVPTPLRWGSGAGGGAEGGGGSCGAVATAAALSSAAQAGGGGGTGGVGGSGSGAAPFATPQPPSRLAGSGGGEAAGASGEVSAEAAEPLPSDDADAMVG